VEVCAGKPWSDPNQQSKSVRFRRSATAKSQTLIPTIPAADPAFLAGSGSDEPEPVFG
jgi:hypothetical protein